MAWMECEQVVEMRQSFSSLSSIYLYNMAGKEKEVLAMENGGNAKVNHIFEAHLNREKPTNHADLQTRERYIRDKYERRKFYDPAAFQSYAASAASRPARPPARQQQHQQQEIALPALLPTPVGPPSDVAQRRIEERRRRQGAAPSPKEKTRSRSGEKSKKGSRKIKSQGSSGSISASSSIDLLDFGSDPTPEPAPASGADLFGFPGETKAAPAPSNHYDAFGSDFFKVDQAQQASPARAAPKSKNNAADIMALYAGGTANNNQSNGNAFAQAQQPMYGNPHNNQNAMNAMTNQMGRMDLGQNYGNANQQMWTPQQQQQMMMMQQQQMMMMMQQQQQRGGGGYGMGNPGMMNGGGMMATAAAAQDNGFGGQRMGGGKKEDPFASLGGRNTFR